MDEGFFIALVRLSHIWDDIWQFLRNLGYSDKCFEVFILLWGYCYHAGTGFRKYAIGAL